MILDDVADPGNLGTIIRLCDATNFKDIILTKGTVDAYNEKSDKSNYGFYSKCQSFLFRKTRNYKTFKGK